METTMKLNNYVSTLAIIAAAGALLTACGPKAEEKTTEKTTIETSHDANPADGSAPSTEAAPAAPAAPAADAAPAEEPKK